MAAGCHFEQVYNSIIPCLGDGMLDPLKEVWRAMLLANFYLGEMDHVKRKEACFVLCEPLFQRHPLHAKFAALDIYHRVAALMHRYQAELCLADGGKCKDCEN